MKTKFTRLMAGLMLIALAFAGGCDKNKAGSTASGSDDSEGSLETRVDRHGDEIMASMAKAEARAWMKQPKHVFFKVEPKQVGQFVEEFYAAGATQVFICDIEEVAGAQY